MSQSNATRILLWLGVLVAAGNLTALGVLWASDTALFAKVVSGNPYLGVESDFTKLHVVFLADRPRPTEIASLHPDRSAPDRFEIHQRQIYLHLPNGAARTKLNSAYFDAKLGTTSTARNWKTVLKLDELAGPPFG